MTEQNETVPDQGLSFGGGGSMLPSVDQQAIVLAEHDKRRKFFFQWLGEHLIEGTHYGTPKGCEPRDPDSKRWIHKPSLYDSGARIFIDLYSVRPTYESDLAVWEMLGKKIGTICRKCKLLRQDGTIVGEGSGVFCVGEKKMNENSAEKMADKRARVAAVLDAFPFLRELFSQDLEGLGSPLDKLKDWILASRVDFEDELSTDDFLAKVAGECLYSKRTITNNAEAKRIEDALARGDFDLKTGERVKTTKVPHEAEDATESTSDAPADLDAAWKLWIALAREAVKGDPERWAGIETDRKLQAREFYRYFSALLGKDVASADDLKPANYAAAVADLAKNNDPRPHDER